MDALCSKFDEHNAMGSFVLIVLSRELDLPRISDLMSEMIVFCCEVGISWIREPLLDVAVRS